MKEKLSLQIIAVIFITSLIGSFAVKLFDVIFNSDDSYAQIKGAMEEEIKTVSASHNTDISTVNIRVGNVESRVSSVEATQNGQTKQLDRMENMLTQLNRKI
jgi:archaellum component FlaF (FlaF/FlaG flagellin family)